MRLKFFEPIELQTTHVVKLLLMGPAPMQCMLCSSRWLRAPLAYRLRVFLPECNCSQNSIVGANVDSPKREQADLGIHTMSISRKSRRRKGLSL